MRARRILSVVLLAAFAAASAGRLPGKAHPLRRSVRSGGSVDGADADPQRSSSPHRWAWRSVWRKQARRLVVPGTDDIVKAAPDGYTLGYGNIVSLAGQTARCCPALPVRRGEGPFTLCRTASVFQHDSR